MKGIEQRWAALERAAVAAGAEKFTPLEPEVLASVEAQLDLAAPWRRLIAQGYPRDGFRLLGRVGRFGLEQRGSQLVDMLAPEWPRHLFPLQQDGGHLVVALDMSSDDGRLVMVDNECADDDGFFFSSPLTRYDGPATIHELLDLAVTAWSLDGELEYVTISLPSERGMRRPPIMAMTEASLARMPSLEPYFDWLEVWSIDSVRTWCLGARNLPRWGVGIAMAILAVVTIGMLSAWVTKGGPVAPLVLLWLGLGAAPVFILACSLRDLRRVQQALDELDAFLAHRPLRQPLRER